MNPIAKVEQNKQKFHSIKTLSEGGRGGGGTQVLTYITKENSIKKWTEDMNRHFSKDTDGQNVHKMFNNQRNTNQNYMRYHLTLIRMAIISKVYKQ